jgi:CRISPR-associated protein Cas1
MKPVRLNDVLTDTNLQQAWCKVFENRGCVGCDGQSLEAFGGNLRTNLDTLRDEVRYGTYRPLPLLRAAIDKPGGGTRMLSIPTVRDRVLQTAVAQALEPLFEAEFEDCSFAYRKGRSVDQAVARVQWWQRQGYEWVVDADIERFFDTIDHERLLVEVGKLVADADIMTLLRQWLHATVLDGRRRSVMREGVAQGSPIAPLLSNLYLDHLDDELLDNNLRLVRFADDFLVLCRSRERAEDALRLTDALLRELRLTLNARKTRIVDFKRGFRFLGVQFIRSLAYKVGRGEADNPFALPQSDARNGVSDAAAAIAGHSVPREYFSKAAPNKFPLPDPLPKGEEVSLTASPAPDDIQNAMQRAFAEAGIRADDFAGGEPDEEDGFGPPDGEVFPAGHDPRLRTLYLMQHGQVLGKESERLTVHRGTDLLYEIPAIKVDQVMVFGNAQITTQAMQFCLLERIPIYLLSGQGRYYGVVDSFGAEPVLLQRDQFLRADDPAFCLRVARALVRGKIANSRVLLLRLARRHPPDALRAAAQTLNESLAQLEDADSLDQLRGFEGNAAKVYFGALAQTLDSAWGFTQRVRRPPTDPVNALLSYGYTVLFYNMYSLLRSRGLNPQVGFLHALRAGHPALASDLIEEFRAPVVDAAVWRLVLNGQLKPEDFDYPQTAGEACLLNPEARRRFIEILEAKLNAAIRHPVSGADLDYRRCMEHQVRHLAAVIRGLEPGYRPMILR